MVIKWLNYIHSQGLSNSAGMRQLNTDLGTIYQDNALYRWRNGSVTPEKQVLDYMRRCIIKGVLEKHLNIQIDDKTALLIAQDLS